MITLEENPGEQSRALNQENAMFYMDRAIRVSIRDVAIVTRYNKQQFLVIMVGTDNTGVRIAVDRIFKRYFRMNGSTAYSPSYAIVESMKGKQRYSAAPFPSFTTMTAFGSCLRPMVCAALRLATVSKTMEKS